MERQAKVHTNRSKEYLKVLKVTFKYIHCLKHGEKYKEEKNK